jgi:hypothetical protein
MPSPSSLSPKLKFPDPMSVPDPMPVQTETAATKALARILHGPQKAWNSNVLFLDYRNSATFKDLWLNGLESATPTINAQQFEWTDGSKQILIIGNDPPDGAFNEASASLKGINFRDHFTATSWLAAWKVKFTPSEEESKNGKQEAMVRIAVIDPREAALGHGAARALQTILGARDSCYHALVPGASVLNAPSLDGICQWLQDSKEDNRLTAGHLCDLLRTTIWNELISNREQHHALSNVVGPMILCSKPENTELCPETLLRKLLSACGFVQWPKRNATALQKHAGENQASISSDTSKQSPQPETRSIASANAQDNERGEGLQLLLVDDQFEQGWLDWVKEILPYAQTEAMTDPIEVVHALENSIKGAGGSSKKDARFSLALPKLEEAVKPVLLLDLRLFSGNTKAELQFYKEKLLPLVRHFTDMPDLAWPGFSSTNPIFRSASEQVADGTLKVGTAVHREALTWLPRVIALADMSLPILLFSSTGRRDLIEPLKPFSNIITIFEKPRLADLRTEIPFLAQTGDAESEIAAEDANATGTSREHENLQAKGQNANEGASQDPRGDAAGSLREAVKAARRWLECRAIAQRINTTLDPLHEARKAFADCTHFEIYHDESGEVEKEGFKVVSLLAGFKSLGAADSYDRVFPVKFYGPQCEPKLAPQSAFDRFWEAEARRWGEDVWPRTKDCAPPLLLSACARGIEASNAGGPDALFDPAGLDNINRDLLELLWESLLADVISSLIQERSKDNITINLYGATRQRPLRLKSASAKEAVQEANSILISLREHWGIDAFVGSFIKDANEAEVCKGESDTELKLNWGCENSPGPFKFCWPSLQDGSFSKLASEVLFGRRQSVGFAGVSKGIRLARGITLRYGSHVSGKPKGARHLHYLADCLARCVFVDSETSTITVVPGVEPFTPSNKINTATLGTLRLRDHLLTILNANRLLDIGGCDAEALVCVECLPHDPPPDLAYLALIERLGKRLEVLRGQDLVRMLGILDTLPDWLSGDRSQVPDRLTRLP